MVNELKKKGKKVSHFIVFLFQDIFEFRLTIYFSECIIIILKKCDEKGFLIIN